MAQNQGVPLRDRAPGAALAAARTAQNLSITDVARQLKLSASQIAALEAGEFDRLPGPVFVRGFVRNYARLLKLDPERLVDSITPFLSEPEARTERPALREIPFPPPPARRWPRFSLVALLALTALAGYEFHWSDRADVVTVTKPAAPPAPPAVLEEPAPRAAAPATASALPAPSAAESAVQPAAGTAVQPAAGTAVQPAQEASEAAPADPQAPVAGHEAGEGELRFAFDRDSWVQVRERSGKTIFTRLNPAGSEQRVSGKPPFTLVIGNAHGVRLTYNERPVDLEPHIVSDDVARFTLE